MTPEEAWSGRKPTVDHFRIFGCIAYAHIPNEKMRKPENKGEKCIFLGVSDKSKAYKLYNPNTMKIVISCDVTIGVKWFYKTKLNENGDVDKHKARLVAKGYKQEFGVDYKEAFVLVTRHDTIKLVIAMVAQKSWPIFLALK
ncbi:Retrovirus-related Pol polyprotein from transposon RE2 [Vitis vinifera]|uniref:Retrovirus-related Pol polyprotein from transposon RE2 n=1 Tax=Vitis vinifera TaxID=29760 RepID=A0A438CI87_VITVI|nr:Retrovirus-related Pol polyprotein from transposon RE2 [Vitis vinifera]